MVILKLLNCRQITRNFSLPHIK